jgi:hypothetical protein
MKTTSILMCGVALAALPGCDWLFGGGGGEGPINPPPNCATFECDEVTKVYQHCTSDLLGQTDTYNFGPSSCSCASNDSSCLTSCTAAVASYCGLSTSSPPDQSVVADAGSNDDGGTDDGGTGATCTATFSGAVVATATCYVMLTNSIEYDYWLLTMSAGILSNPAYQWSGISFSQQGDLATDTYNLGAAFSASTTLVTPDADSPLAQWAAIKDLGVVVGSAQLTLSSLGEPDLEPNQLNYRKVHGTWTGTLANQLGGQAPVQLTVSF